MVCQEIREEIKKRGFKITFDKEDDKHCILNFHYPPAYKKVAERYGEEEAMYKATSSIVVEKEKDRIEMNLVSPPESFCELYLEYCCKNNSNICRLHIDPEAPMRVGLEIKPLSKKDLEKVKEALDDFYNCIT